MKPRSRLNGSIEKDCSPSERNGVYGVFSRGRGKAEAVDLLG